MFLFALLLAAAQGDPDVCIGDWTTWSDCSATCGIGTKSHVFKYRSGVCMTPDGTVETAPCILQSCPMEPSAPFVSISSVVPDSWCQDVCKPDWNGVFPSACVENPASPLDQKCTNRVPFISKDKLPKEQMSKSTIITVEGVTKQAEIPIQQFIPADIPVKYLAGTDCRGSWTQWSQCDKPCGGGVQTRTFTIAVPASPLGKRCAYSNGYVETQPCSPEPCKGDTVVQETIQQGAPLKPCTSIAPEVTDWWCMRNCIPDGTGNMPPFCRAHPITPSFQKCVCDGYVERFGCWATSPTTTDAWCSMVCTTMDDNGDVHAACKPGPFQECQCRFQPLPADLRPPVPLKQAVSKKGTLVPPIPVTPVQAKGVKMTQVVQQTPVLIPGQTTQSSP